MNDNKNLTYQTSGIQLEQSSEEVIAVNAYIKKENRSQIYNLIFYLRKTAENKTKTKESRRKLHNNNKKDSEYLRTHACKAAGRFSPGLCHLHLLALDTAMKKQESFLLLWVLKFY